jgi:hypothetical protein
MDQAHPCTFLEFPFQKMVIDYLISLIISHYTDCALHALLIKIILTQM